MNIAVQTVAQLDENFHYKIKSVKILLVIKAARFDIPNILWFAFFKNWNPDTLDLNPLLKMLFTTSISNKWISFNLAIFLLKSSLQKNKTKQLTALSSATDIRESRVTSYLLFPSFMKFIWDCIEGQRRNECSWVHMRWIPECYKFGLWHCSKINKH